MTCPFLEYRRESGDVQFDAARAYCGAAERFVQPMRADVCNDRYDLDHADHCEIYREHVDDVGDGDGGDAGAGDAEAGDGDAEASESNDAGDGTEVSDR